MYSSMLAVLAVVAATASATPVLEARGGKDWQHNAKGNIKIHLSDETVNLGTLKIDDVMKVIATACNDDGTCDTSSQSLDGRIAVMGGRGGTGFDSFKLTVNPSGQYQPWMHNGLVDALSQAVVKASKCQINQFSPKLELNKGPTYCHVPKYWGISYVDAKDGDAHAPSAMMASLSASGAGSGFCDTFATVGSAIAGAIDAPTAGAASGAFSLIGLFCDSAA